MMITLLIIGLIIGIASIIIALQNIELITITLFSWHFTGSIALMILIAIVIGVVITILFILPISVKNYLTCRKLKKENEKLTEELRKQKELTVFAKKEIPTEEIISQIEEGAIDHPSDNKRK